MVQSAIKHLRNALIALVMIVILGIAGYMSLEGWNFADSLYMVIITITTVKTSPIKVQ